jgi:hypothetical protein
MKGVRIGTCMVTSLPRSLSDMDTSLRKVQQ